MTDFLIPILPTLSAVALGLMLFVYVWRQPGRTPLRMPLLALTSTVVVWSLSSLLMVAIPASPYLQFFHILKYGAVAFIGPLFTLFALRLLAGHGIVLRAYRASMDRWVLAVGAVDAVACATNPWHQQYFTLDAGGLAHFERVFWLHTAVGYAFAGVSLALFVYALRASRAILLRQRIYYLAGCAIVPLAINGFWLAGWLRMETDPAPLAFAAAWLFFVVGVTRVDLFSVEHVALRQALAGAHAGYIVFDLSGSVLYTNGAACRMLVRPDLPQGVDVRDLWAQVFAPDEAERVRALVTRALTGQHAEYEALTLRTRGEPPAWLQISLPALSDERAISLLLTLRDITERMQAEDALRRSEASLAYAQEIARIGNHEWDLHTNMVVSSAEAARITGLPMDTERIPIEVFLDAVHPDDRPALLDVMAAVAGGDGPAQLEYRFARRPDGEELVLLGTGQAVLDEAGTPVRVVGTIQDITERKVAEEAHRRLQEHLQQAQKMEAVGTLAGGIAHDFNNLLTGILGGIQLSLMDVPPDSTTATNLRQAEEAAERAAELTKQLLTLSRKQAPEMGPTAINDVVQRTARLLRRSITETIEIRVVSDPSVPTIEGDAGQLGQALLNLGINARDAMPDGGHLTFETGIVDIDDDYVRAHSHARPGKFVRIAVSDTGEGMAPGVLDHIFEPFYTTKEQGKGTGLGLAMVYACLQAHRGWVTVRSEPWQGTTFQLYIPLVKARSAPPVTRAGDAPRGTETLLLVDDTDAVLFLGRGMLERCGYEVIIAWDGDDALEKFEQHAADIALVVSDLVMPHAGGRHLLHALRDRGVDVPVVLTSGYAVDGRPEGMMAEGFAAFVPKPFDLHTLATTVRRVLDTTACAPPV